MTKREYREIKECIRDLQTAIGDPENSREDRIDLQARIDCLEWFLGVATLPKNI